MNRVIESIEVNRIVVEADGLTQEDASALAWALERSLAAELREVHAVIGCARMPVAEVHWAGNEPVTALGRRLGSVIANAIRQGA